MGSRMYSERLGVLDDRQFQTALARLGLGDFVRAEPLSGGLFGQNIFLTSTTGAWVLRGVPHYDWQLPAEQFFCELLHTRTSTPVPWPYLLDPREDIFGWSYAIMPRMPGLQPSDPGVDGTLTRKDRLGMAHAMAENLALMHELSWPFAGGFDLASGTIAPCPVSWAEWVAADVHGWLDLARKHSDHTMDADIDWVDQLLRRYLELRPARRGFAERFVVYLLWDRLVVWEYFQRPERETPWKAGLTLRAWLEPILEACELARLTSF